MLRIAGNRKIQSATTLTILSKCYDTARCSPARLDANAVEHAVIAALACVYRDQHDLIADAIAQAQADHAAGQDGKRAELTAAEDELARTGAAIDRYLTAFENGTLEPEDLAERLAERKARSQQLRASGTRSTAT